MKRKNIENPLRIHGTKIFACAILFILFASTANAIPKLINLEGKLTDDLGNALNENVGFTFQIYNVSTGGTALWTEIHTDVPVSNGLFDVLLGSQTLLDLPFDQDYWLAIMVNGELMTQRAQIASVGYAYRADVADDLSCTDCIGGTEILEPSLSGTAGGLTAGSAHDLYCADCIGSEEIQDIYAWKGSRPRYSRSLNTYYTESSDGLVIAYGCVGSDSCGYLCLFTGETTLGQWDPCCKAGCNQQACGTVVGYVQQGETWRVNADVGFGTAHWIPLFTY